MYLFKKLYQYYIKLSFEAKPCKYNDSTSNYTTLLVEVVASLTSTLAAVFDALARFVASLALTLVFDGLAGFVESLALARTSTRVELLDRVAT